MRRTCWMLLLAVACKPDEPELDERLLDAETCAECHPQHHREWLGSMHAYAGEDPVFRAMNARGQRETGGALGDFCVRCHAPVAVALGLTTDGTNLDEIEPHLLGVTCFACHAVEAVEGTHNNPLVLAMDGVMRGGIVDPVDNEAHASAYSPYLDETAHEAGQMCGSCHDVVNPAGVHLERTYAEWLESFMSDVDPVTLQPEVYALRCGTCHMGPATAGPIADAPGVRADRIRHPHLMPGVDIALTDFPDAALGPELRAEQLTDIERQRSTALCASVCVTEVDDRSYVDVYLHNEFAAHGWPSGANQDRRAWMELVVQAGGAEVFATGVIADDQAVDEVEDPNLWLFRDRMFDAEDHEVHMFWEAARYESAQLPASAILSPQGDVSTWRVRRHELDVLDIERIDLRVRLRPMDLAILDDLIESGDLDPSVRAAMQTFSVAPTVLAWTSASVETFEGYGVCVSSSNGCGAPLVGVPPPT